MHRSKGERRRDVSTPAICLLCSTTVAFVGHGAAAEEAAADFRAPEEIVVTAQRREETLQRAAIPVSAISGDMLVGDGVSATTDLTKLVPSLVVQPAGGSMLNFYLRGVGTLQAMPSGKPAT